MKIKSLAAQFKLAEKIAEHVERNRNASRFIPFVYVLDAIGEFEREGFEINVQPVIGGDK